MRSIYHRILKPEIIIQRFVLKPNQKVAFISIIYLMLALLSWAAEVSFFPLISLHIHICICICTSLWTPAILFPFSENVFINIIASLIRDIRFPSQLQSFVQRKCSNSLPIHSSRFPLFIYHHNIWIQNQTPNTLPVHVRLCSLDRTFSILYLLYVIMFAHTIQSHRQKHPFCISFANSISYFCTIHNKPDWSSIEYTFSLSLFKRHSFFRLGKLLLRPFYYLKLLFSHCSSMHWL